MFCYRPFLLALFSLLLVMAGCTPTAADETLSGIEVHDAWGRLAPMAANTSSFYMELHNHEHEDDLLLEVMAEDCVSSQLHESTMTDGVVRMQPVAEVLVPGDGVLMLEPGGIHIMCLDLTEGLTEGDEVPVTLVFEQAGEVPVMVEMRDDAP
ncbi:MAG: copper chaperone PCu(A)C [Candidatus Promineifilaceae bacterium]|nr:copper chaperone PCu(A)C [Candidatus Promineifilaceae bacterium]